jgi:hypothetical protein
MNKNEILVNYPHDLTELLFAYVCLHPEEFGAL